MTDRQAIEHLKTTTPRVELTRWQKAARVLSAVFAGVAVLALATAIYAVQKAVIASRHADAASQSALDVAKCMNTTLGIRQKYSDADHDNERQKIADQAIAEKTTSRGVAQLLAANTPAEAVAAVQTYTRGVAQFSKSLADWTTRDQAITAQRALHPLGHC